MTLPALQANGLLPPGIYDSTLTELFATYPPVTPRRQLLNDELAKFAQAMRTFGFAQDIVIDGSYNTAKPEPDDVDMTIWTSGIPATVAEADLRAVGVDIDHLLHIWFEHNKQLHDDWIEFFTRVTGTRNRKGVVRLLL